MASQPVKGQVGRTQEWTEDVPSTALFNLRDIKLKQAVQPMQQLLSRQLVSNVEVADDCTGSPRLAHDYCVGDSM